MFSLRTRDVCTSTCMVNVWYACENICFYACCACFTRCVVLVLFQSANNTGLLSVASQDSGFTSQDALFARPAPQTPLSSHGSSNKVCWVGIFSTHFNYWNVPTSNWRGIPSVSRRFWATRLHITFGRQRYQVRVAAWELPSCNRLLVRFVATQPSSWHCRSGAWWLYMTDNLTRSRLWEFLSNPIECLPYWKNTL